MLMVALYLKYVSRFGRFSWAIYFDGLNEGFVVICVCDRAFAAYFYRSKKGSDGLLEKLLAEQCWLKDW